MRGLRKRSRSLCKSPATPDAEKEPGEPRRKEEDRMKRRRRSSKLQVREGRATLRRMSVEVAEQRAQLVRMREETEQDKAAVEELEVEIARMTRQNRAITLLHYMICELEADE